MMGDEVGAFFPQPPCGKVSGEAMFWIKWRVKNLCEFFFWTALHLY